MARLPHFLATEDGNFLTTEADSLLLVTDDEDTSTMTTAIVTVTAQVIAAPQPNTLQQTGAFVTQGGTVNAANSLTQAPTLAALTAMLAPGQALTSLAVARQLSGTGGSGAGSVTLTGAVVGQAVFRVYDSTTSADVTADFEATISVTNQIQQTGGTLTGNTLVVTLASAPSSTVTMVWGVAAAPLGYTVGEQLPVVIAGSTPAGYNGNVVATIITTTKFTYPLAVNPGPETIPGTINLGAASELLQMATTYFAQNIVVAPYVLELGEGNVTDGVAALTTWLTNHPKTVYSYLIPREWDASSAFLTLIASYAAPSKETYFYTTTTVANRDFYQDADGGGYKDVFLMVEAPGIPATEFSCAAPFAVTLAINPSSTNRVAPLSYATLFGVTAWPTAGNQTTFNELAAADVNWVSTGAEGGLPSSTILKQGNMADGNPWNFWYAGDWCQINIALALANEIINGSVPGTLAPLYYDQDGINRLQNRALQVMQQAVAYGLAVGQVKAYQLPAAQFAANFANNAYEGQLPVNAEPFFVYSNENPDDYADGRYAGMAAVVTPLRGFLNLFFSLNLTNLISG